MTLGQTFLGLGVLACVMPVAAGTVTVNRLDDIVGSCPTTCTLRAALGSAAPGDRIEFSAALALPGTIALSQGPLVAAGAVEIAGPGAGRLTVSAAQQHRVLNVTAAGVEIRGLSLSSGRTLGVSGFPGGPGSPVNGGCVNIGVGASLRLVGALVGDCLVQGGAGGDGTSGAMAGNGGAGGGGLGGAFHVAGHLELVDSSIAASIARGGSGGVGGTGQFSHGNGGNGGSGQGGGIYVAANGSLEMRNVTVVDAQARGGDGGAAGGPGATGGNGGDGIGGALAVAPGSAPVAVSFVTVDGRAYGTSATGGGSAGIGLGNALATTRAVTIRSGVLLGTQASVFACSASASHLIALDANLASDESCPGFTLISDPETELDAPRVGANGTLAYPLRRGSILIDAASACLDALGQPVDADQFGTRRPLDGDSDGEPRCDVGAVEDDRLFENGFELAP